jgi:hypothetical protein
MKITLDQPLADALKDFQLTLEDRSGASFTLTLAQSGATITPPTPPPATKTSLDPTTPAGQAAKTALLPFCVAKANGTLADKCQMLRDYGKFFYQVGLVAKTTPNVLDPGILWQTMSDKVGEEPAAFSSYYGTVAPESRFDVLLGFASAVHDTLLSLGLPGVVPS